MYLDQGGKCVRTDIWREGRWFDLWSLVHCLSGITGGFLFRYLGLDNFSAYAISFLLLVLYEMFEALAKIEETPQNRTMDVVVGMASFIPAYYLNPFLSLPANVIFGAVFFAISLTLGAIGWRASKKAAAFEVSMREKIAESREHFRLQRARRRMNRAKRKALREIKKSQKI